MFAVGIFVLDEICAVALGAACARLFWRALECGITCAASVLTRTTRSLETRIAAMLDALDGDDQPLAARRPRLQDATRRARPCKNRAPTVVEESRRDPAAVYISLTSPPKIVKASPEWLAMFRLEATRCLGRTLNCVKGPETAAEKLAGLVDGVVHSAKTATTRVVLYTSEGKKALYAIRASPARGPLGHPPVCKLTMVKSDAVPYKMAAADDGSCKLLVEAAKPFRVVYSSDEFERKYDFTREYVVNRSLSLIQGPNTDMGAWRGLFDSVLTGRSQHLPLVHTYARNGTDESVCLRLMPVLGASDIDFVLVTLDPPEPSNVVYPSTLLNTVSESVSCQCPTEVATGWPGSSRVCPNKNQSRSSTSPTEHPLPRMDSQEPFQKGRRLSAQNISATHMAPPQQAPDSWLLSHENVLAHEQQVMALAM